MIYKRILAILLVVVLLALFAPATLATNQDDPWSVHEHDYYGRNLLEEMTDSAALLYAYDQLAAGVELGAESISVYNGTDPLTSENWAMVLDLYKRDYTQHFWVDEFSVTSNSDTILSVSPTYSFTGVNLTQARTWFDLAVNEILVGITEDMSALEKELYIHDTLAQRIVYYEGTANCHNAYGAIVEGYATCDGYAEALQYLLHREGIQSFIAIGYGYNFKRNEYAAHAWNYVCIDGKYYQVDLTWDDKDEYISHEYFNSSDTEMAEYHYPSSVNYYLPVCNSYDANYHAVRNTRLDTYTAKTIGELLKANDNTVYVYIPGDVNTFLSWFSQNVKSIATAAGIPSGYSITYGRLNREFVIILSKKNAAANVATVETALGTHTSYTSVSAAIAAAGSGYVKLLADCSEDLTISEDLHIDLNGYNMTGKITVAEGAVLYGMDSATDDYNCADGYGQITNITGAYAPYHKSAVAGAIKRYMAISEDGAVSFHRFFLGVVYVSIQPCSTGLGYKAIFAGDQMVVEQLDEDRAYGYKLGLEGGNEVCVYNDRDHFVSGRKVSMLVNNYDIENYGETGLYAAVMIQLKDGTVIESAEVSTNMRAMLENLNEHVSILSSVQFSALREMLQAHPITKLWKTEYLYQ